MARMPAVRAALAPPGAPPGAPLGPDGPRPRAPHDRRFVVELPARSSRAASSRGGATGCGRRARARRRLLTLSPGTSAARRRRLGSRPAGRASARPAGAPARASRVRQRLVQAPAAVVDGEVAPNQPSPSVRSTPFQSRAGSASSRVGKVMVVGDLGIRRHQGPSLAAEEAARHWSGRWDSNPHPRAPKARAPPLRHAPTGFVPRKRMCFASDGLKTSLQRSRRTISGARGPPALRPPPMEPSPPSGRKPLGICDGAGSSSARSRGAMTRGPNSCRRDRAELLARPTREDASQEAARCPRASGPDERFLRPPSELRERPPLPHSRTGRGPGREWGHGEGWSGAHRDQIHADREHHPGHPGGGLRRKGLGRRGPGRERERPGGHRSVQLGYRGPGLQRHRRWPERVRGPYGVWADGSTIGAQGRSWTGIGVRGEATTGVGVHATATTGTARGLGQARFSPQRPGDGAQAQELRRHHGVAGGLTSRSMVHDDPDLPVRSVDRRRPDQLPNHRQGPDLT